MIKTTLLYVQALFLFLVTSSSVPAQTKAPSHDNWNALLKKHVTAEGKVDYKGFLKDSTALNTYLTLLSKGGPEASWTMNEKKVYWINAYNAFTVKLILKHYPLKSIKDVVNINIPFIHSPWDIKFIKIGKETLDLNNIEHGHLRKDFDDPRIHFAIVCASKSCPKLLNEAYTADKVDAQLDQEAKAFLADKTRNVVTEKEPKLSMLFLWYKGDFTKKESLIDFLNKYAPLKIDKKASVSHLTYDWTLNE